MLLATSPSLEMMVPVIERFYCGTAVELRAEASGTWGVYRKSDQKFLADVIVRKKARRFRFEQRSA
jgi:hypothetical protein